MNAASVKKRHGSACPIRPPEAPIPLTAARGRTYSAGIASDDEGESGETPELARNCMPKPGSVHRQDARDREASQDTLIADSFVERFVVQA